MKTLKNILFWFWSCTYGCVMTLVGAIGALVCLITGHKPYLFNGRVYFMIVNNYWGGMEAGPFFFTDKRPTLSLKQHECGHGIQNLYLGPLFPFVVGLRSVARYWLREFKTHKTRCIYCGVLTLIVTLFIGSLVAITVLFPLIWLIIVTSIIGIYLTFVVIWLWIECKKHKERFPDYDAFFWEGNASRVGAKLFPKNIK